MSAVKDVEFVSAKELAAKLGVSLSVVYRQAKSGGIPCIRIGASYRFVVAEVLAALRKSTEVKRESDEAQERNLPSKHEIRRRVRKTPALREVDWGA